MKRKFFILGQKPAYGKQANDFIEACDLGIQGGFVKLSEVATITLSEDVTEKQMVQQPGGIQKAYEQLGCMNIQVIEIPIAIAI